MLLVILLEISCFFMMLLKAKQKKSLLYRIHTFNPRSLQYIFKIKRRPSFKYPNSHETWIYSKIRIFIYASIVIRKILKRLGRNICIKMVKF